MSEQSLIPEHPIGASGANVQPLEKTVNVRTIPTDEKKRMASALSRFELLLLRWAGVGCSWPLLHALGFSRAECQLITTTLPVRFVWCKPEVLGRRKEHLGGHGVCAAQYAYVTVRAFSVDQSDSTCSVRLV